MTSTNRFDLPAGLPVPVDDGACDHLTGFRIPALTLQATDGNPVTLSTLPGTTLVYCYPRTGQVDQPIPEGWDAIPGARGCTPQSCSFRDHAADLKRCGVDQLFGFSTQDTMYQREVVARLHLPFPILSDVNFDLTDALRLPTFHFGQFGRLVKRITLIIKDGEIVKVFYPVFPPDRNASEVVQWLKDNQATQT